MFPERVLGTDGKTYPSRWYSAETREWLAGRVHYLSHDEGMSVRRIQAALAEQHDVRRSVGWISSVLTGMRCNHCSGESNESPEQSAGHQHQEAS